jgi:hypothetical protein
MLLSSDSIAKCQVYGVKSTSRNVPEREFESILIRPAEEGEERALADVDLDGDEAGLDIRGLRSLVDCISGIDSPMPIKRPINGESFLAYVRKVIVPTLHPGDVVIMDNLGRSEGQGLAMREAIEAAGAELRFLPAYRRTRTPPPC